MLKKYFLIVQKCIYKQLDSCFYSLLMYNFFTTRGGNLKILNTRLRYYIFFEVVLIQYF